MTPSPTVTPGDKTVTSDDLQRFLWGIPGTVLTLSVIGAPIGIPMLFRAHAHQRRLGDASGGTRAGPIATIRESFGHLLGGESPIGKPPTDKKAVWTDGGPGRNS